MDYILDILSIISSLLLIVVTVLSMVQRYLGEDEDEEE